MQRNSKDHNIQRIEAIIRSKGWFSVSWRWRDDSLRRYCYKFVEKKRLKVIRGIRGETVFVRHGDPVPADLKPSIRRRKKCR